MLLKECKWEYLIEKWERETGESSTIQERFNHTFNEIVWYKEEVIYYLYKNIKEHPYVSLMLCDILKDIGFDIPEHTKDNIKDMVVFWDEFFNKDGRVLVFKDEIKSQFTRK